MDDIEKLKALGDGPENNAERDRLIERLCKRYSPRMNKLDAATESGDATGVKAAYARERAVFIMSGVKARAVVTMPMLAMLPIEFINSLCAACFTVGYMEAADPAPDDAPVDDEAPAQSSAPTSDDLEKLWNTPVREPCDGEAKG